MLPFLKPKFNPGIFNHKRKPDETTDGGVDQYSQHSEVEAIEACIEDFIRALNNRDTKKMANIVKLAHDILHEYMDEKPEQKTEENQ